TGANWFSCASRSVSGTLFFACQSVFSCPLCRSISGMLISKLGYLFRLTRAFACHFISTTPVLHQLVLLQSLERAVDHRLRQTMDLGDVADGRAFIFEHCSEDLILTPVGVCLTLSLLGFRQLLRYHRLDESPPAVDEFGRSGGPHLEEQWLELWSSEFPLPVQLGNAIS